MYTLWNGSSWSTPAALATGLVGVSQHCTAISGAAASILVSRDPDPATEQDEILEAYTWTGSSWSGASTFASGGGGNILPSVVFDSVGEAHVVWLRGEDLVHATLTSPTPEIVRAGSGSVAFYSTQLLSNTAGNLTLVWQEIVDNAPANIFAMVYDPASST